MNSRTTFSILLMTVWNACLLVAAPRKEAPSPVGQCFQCGASGRQRDFPTMALDDAGTPWVAFVEFDGKDDTLKLATKHTNGLAVVATMSKPGIVHHPAIAVGRDGAAWCFWGQVDARDVVTLRARRYADGKLDGEITLASSEGSDTFADAGTDHLGRVWVVWQSLRRGQGDIYARWLDAETGTWSPEIAVSTPKGGNWEPRVALDGRDGAWVAFDSSREDRVFNLYLAHVGLDGTVKEIPLTQSPEYEARARIAASRDGRSLWITAERGHEDWGRRLRGHAGIPMALNDRKRLLLGRFDIASGSFAEVTVPAGGKPAPTAAGTVNLPAISLDAAGNVLLAWRYYNRTHWEIALARYELGEKSWSQPLTVPRSAFCQDRHSVFVASGEAVWLCWPSDLRQSKAGGRASVFLAQLNASWSPYKAPAAAVVSFKRRPYLNAPSPPRPLDMHHTWTVGGKTYRLVFGDLHRHTDFSNCRTPRDGCILEAYRYAFDVAGLDFLGISDHTDVGKKYTPYEWWQSQRLVDVFYVPGRFNSLYAYEREQQFPWGHRNVIFAQRGGPIVYIRRDYYRSSRWNALYPVAEGPAQIAPTELWAILEKCGTPVATVSHTGATGMGTDWDRYKSIDNKIENTVEIYQGARVSYEGLGAPQPTAGLRVGQPYTADTATKVKIPSPPAAISDFGKIRNNGVYQKALANGFKLGVFASSDHIATHTAFGGVYVEKTNRMGIIEGLRARRSIAATDKIFVEFTCNGNPMGAVFRTDAKPEIGFTVHGTAPLARLTLVRNEQNYKSWEPNQIQFTTTFTDAEPLPGENRYYLRVEQNDGNMAWSSPVWATISQNP